MTGSTAPADSPLGARIREARSLNGISPDQAPGPFESVGALLKAQVEKHRTKPWLISYTDAPSTRTLLTYGEFFDRVNQCAGFLFRSGVRRGDRIATIAYNHHETVIQYFGAWMIGAVVVPINVGEDDRRIAYILRNSTVKLAFVREEFLERAAALIGGSLADLNITLVSSATFNATLDREPATLSTATPVMRGDEALIVYTSGTTGNPKGVVLTHFNLLTDSRAIADWHRVTEEQTMMCVLPIHHVNGTVVTLLAPLAAGATVVLNQKFHTQHFFTRLASENVNVVSVVPSLLQFLLHEYAGKEAPLHPSLRHIICGAGPLTVELASAFEDRFGIPIVHGYGLSETTCYSCFLPLDLGTDEHDGWMRRHGFPSIGVALPPNEMAIHDDHGKPVPEGTKGEIVIRGHTVMKEYFANPEANENAFTYGWFRSGDEGFCRSDGAGRMFYFITGRIKELIIRGGMNISPLEIDEVLMAIPGVHTGLAVGFDNDWYGEEVGAYVRLREGASLSEEAILTHCRKSLSYQKMPKVVVFGEEIPVTSTGKYQRTKLKALFAQWKSVQFSERGGTRDAPR